MCRNIKTLFNFDPTATDEEIRASALQYVRKLAGTTTPRQANQAAFNRAVHKVELATKELLLSLVTSAPAKNREEEAQKLRLRAKKRFGESGAESS